jgi:Xaa-Pro aminopeptidase
VTSATAPALPAMEVAARAERLAAGLDEPKLDGLLVTHATNIRYLTGFAGSASQLLVLPTALTLVTDGRYGEQAEQELAAAGVDARIDVGRTESERRAAMSGAVAGIRRLGLEATHVSWAEQRELAEAWSENVELVPAAGLVEALRVVKDAGEVARIEAGAAIADEALSAVRGRIADGLSERELALELEVEMRRLGAVDRAFDVIVATGPNAARPHAQPSDRQLREGDLVLLDFGALVDGYRSDVTRTFILGEPTTTQLRMLEVVTAAQAAGVDAVAAGVVAGKVDQVCRDVIDAAGWADAFLHTTGHGIGLDLHELPWLERDGSETLAPGQVVTVEPGVYLVDHGGVRVEDIVLVTQDGARPLTHSPKDWAL